MKKDGKTQKSLPKQSIKKYGAMAGTKSTKYVGALKK